MTVRDRDLRLVAGAIGVSAIGDFIALIALALRIHDMWKSFGVAILFICLWSPLVLLAGHVGILVDKLETRSLAIVAAAFQAVIAVGLAFCGVLFEPIVLKQGDPFLESLAADNQLYPRGLLSDA